MSAEQILTMGVAACQLGHGVQRHHLDRLARAGAIPYLTTGGGSRLRLVRAADLPAIRAECEKRGYYRPTEELTAV